MNNIFVWLNNNIFLKNFFLTRMSLKIEAIYRILRAKNFKASTGNFAIDYSYDKIKDCFK